MAQLARINCFFPRSFTGVALRLVLLVFIGLMPAKSVQGQAWEGAGRSPEATEQTQGYWRLKTNVADRSTSIRFYSPTDELLYEEEWPGKWVKLTAKNRKYLDRLLAQLMSRNLVASRIETLPLPAVPTRNESDNRIELSGTSNNTLASPSPVFAYVNRSGQLYLAVDNPSRLRCKVSVTDANGLSLYEEFTYLDQYRKWLDISNLAQSSIQLVVRINDKSFLYHVRRKNSQRYELASPSEESAFVTF